jgi:dihydroneopterin aldolase
MKQESRVFLRNLEIEADIGCYAQEKGVPQPLVVTVELALDVERFADDDLDRTVDYTKLAEHARSLGRSHIDLIETFAERLAERCLGFPGVSAVRVRIEKPRAVPGATAGAEIVRLRHREA